MRQVYSGALTCSANWYEEFKRIAFWDALDYIGVQGCFPLTDGTHPELEALLAGRRPHAKALEAVSRRFHKPVLFTEIGYKSRADAAVTPRGWPGRQTQPATEDELETQARCYEAFFRTFWSQDWVAGAYFWKWVPQWRSQGPGRRDFSPQGKPAERVLARGYEQTPH